LRNGLGIRPTITKLNEIAVRAHASDAQGTATTTQAKDQ